MEQYLDIVRGIALFDGIDASELSFLLDCLGARVVSYQKEETVLLAGDRPESVGVVLTGQLHVVWDDCDGNRVLVTALTQGKPFAETLCCAGVAESPVSVIAETAAAVMALNFKRILYTCPSACPYHTKLIENMLGLIANKTLQLQSRMEIVCLKSVRAKVVRCLELFKTRQGRGAAAVTVPFNREGMADFLCVERSALSHELSKMKREGLLDYRKNTFTPHWKI